MGGFWSGSGEFVVGCNYWASHAGTRMWSDWRLDVVDRDLRMLSKAGIQALRVFPLWPDFQPIIMLHGYAGHAEEIRFGEEPLPDDDLGGAGVSAEAMERFAELTEIASKHGLRLIVGLLTGWMSGRMYAPSALLKLNVITDPVAIMWETRFVKAFVRRFRDAECIAAWDLGNECNCMGDAPSREAAYVWTATIADAIRSVDSSRPVVSGMHSLELDGKWAMSDQGELLDILTTHPYPTFTPHCDMEPLNTMRASLHAAAESRLYADVGGKPCIAEELGTLGPMIAGDAVAADYVRACLFSLWAHDCRAMLWWCAFDQDRLEHAPYDWCMVERELGLVRSDGSPKPVLGEIGRFRRFIDGLPFRLPAHTTEAVCILTGSREAWDAAYATFTLAQQAGFDIRFADARRPLPESKVYLLPSIRGFSCMSRRRWLELLARVEDGATLYISMDGALVSHFTEFTGLRVHTRERRTSPMTIGFPGVPEIGEMTFPSEFRLTLDADEAEVLGYEPDGNPAFTRVKRGKGLVYLLTCPLETALAAQPGAFGEGSQEYWRIMNLVMQDSCAERVVTKDSPALGVTEHPVDDVRRVMVGVNYAPVDRDYHLSLADGWRLSEVVYGSANEVSDGEVACPVGANDAVVLMVERR